MNLPSHLSERNFRLYEPHINQAVKNWPNETAFLKELHKGEHDKQLSPSTWSARFRDSIVSLKRFSWETYIDTKKLWSLTGQYRVVMELDGTVWFRQRGKQGRPTELTQEARDHGYIPPVGFEPAFRTHTPSIWPTITYDELQGLCVLLHSGKLTGPYLVTGNVDPSGLPERYNVAITFDPVLNQTIIS